MPVPDGAVEYILDQLTKRLDQTAERLEDGMGRMDLTFVRKDVYDQTAATANADRATLAAKIEAADAELRREVKDLDRRIRAMEDSRQWLFRVASGSFITALISVAFILVQGIGDKQ